MSVKWKEVSDASGKVIGFARDKVLDDHGNVVWSADGKKAGEEPKIIRIPELAKEAWHSVYARYGDLVGRSPRNWACVHAVLCARMGRSLAFNHAYPHYGMEYVMMLTTTGAGNTTAIRLARTLVGPHVKVRHNVQSGQALGEILANFSFDKKGMPENIVSTPCLLAESEMAGFFKLGKGINSSLFNETSRLYDAEDTHHIIRVSHRPNFTIPYPSLSILGAIPISNFLTMLSEGMVTSGMMNRFLIFIVEGEEKKAFAQAYDNSELTELSMSLPQDLKLGHVACQVKSLFGPEALEVYTAWWEKARENENVSCSYRDWYRRQQAHFFRVALSCAYYESRAVISFQDALCAVAVMDHTNACIAQIAEDVVLSQEGESISTQRFQARAWIVQKLERRGSLTKRQFQVECYNLRGGKGKFLWPAVNEELSIMLKSGTLSQNGTGSFHLP